MLLLNENWDRDVDFKFMDICEDWLEWNDSEFFVDKLKVCIDCGFFCRFSRGIGLGLMDGWYSSLSIFFGL